MARQMPMRLIPLLVCLALLSACTGTEPTPAAPAVDTPSATESAENAGRESVETADPRGACPAELFRPRPADGAEPGEAWLCKYTTVGNRRMLRGGVLLTREQASELHRASHQQPGGMVDCATDPSRPAYTVSGRTARGERRFVTVDFSVCATLSVYVGDRFRMDPTYLIAGRRHLALLEELWRDAHDSPE